MMDNTRQQNGYRITTSYAVQFRFCCTRFIADKTVRYPADVGPDALSFKRVPIVGMAVAVLCLSSRQFVYVFRYPGSHAVQLWSEPDIVWRDPSPTHPAYKG